MALRVRQDFAKYCKYKYTSSVSVKNKNFTCITPFRPTFIGMKNLYENGPNPFFVFFKLMGTRMVQIRIAKSAIADTIVGGFTPSSTEVC